MKNHHILTHKNSDLLREKMKANLTPGSMIIDETTIDNPKLWLVISVVPDDDSTRDDDDHLVFSNASQQVRALAPDGVVCAIDVYVGDNVVFLS